MRARLLPLFPFLGLALAVVFLPAPFSPSPVTREVTINAEQFAFDPPVLRVNQGDRVILTVQATDVVHGLYLDEYGINVRVEPGVSQQVEFVADRTGKFRYRCSVACGTLHPFMIGEMVVGPNLPFLRAVGLLLVVVAATLFYLWRFPFRAQGEQSLSVEGQDEQEIEA
jgi:cytochrome c oxidase subunit 2